MMLLSNGVFWGLVVRALAMAWVQYRLFGPLGIRFWFVFLPGLVFARIMQATEAPRSSAFETSTLSTHDFGAELITRLELYAIVLVGYFVCRAVGRVLRKWDEARTERRLNSFKEG